MHTISRLLPIHGVRRLCRCGSLDDVSYENLVFRAANERLEGIEVSYQETHSRRRLRASSSIPKPLRCGDLSVAGHGGVSAGSWSLDVTAFVGLQGSARTRAPRRRDSFQRLNLDCSSDITIFSHKLFQGTTILSIRRTFDIYLLLYLRSSSSILSTASPLEPSSTMPTPASNKRVKVRLPPFFPP